MNFREAIQAARVYGDVEAIMQSVSIGAEQRGIRRDRGAKISLVLKDRPDRLDKFVKCTRIAGIVVTIFGSIFDLNDRRGPLGEGEWIRPLNFDAVDN